MQADSSPALRPHRSASGGFSRRLVSATGHSGRWLARDLRTHLESLRLLGYGFVEFFTMVGFTVRTLLSTWGWAKLDPGFAKLRRNAERQRAWASRKLGRQLTTSYEAPSPPSKGTGLAPLAAQLQDRSKARDVDWHFANPLATLAGGAIALGMLISGWIMSIQSLHWLLNDRQPWTSIDEYGDILWSDGGPSFAVFGSPVYTVPGALQVLALGIGLAVAAPFVGRLVQRAHARWVGYMLATDSSGELQERVETLTQTRKSALELQEAEIKRIERDLHDGAQARLVTMGMTLTQVERLLEHDPLAARGLLESAKGDSAEALKELRELVRGIRPPILADRGLADALRSLAATSPIETRVVSRLPGRVVPTLETALYFAVAELLANAIKHSAASEVVIELESGEKWVTSRVTDNGIGGADEPNDGGLAGIRRRLAAFDGKLDFISPVGGPTIATVTVPTPSTSA